MGRLVMSFLRVGSNAGAVLNYQQSVYKGLSANASDVATLLVKGSIGIALVQSNYEASFESIKLIIKKVGELERWTIAYYPVEGDIDKRLNAKRLDTIMFRLFGETANEKRVADPDSNYLSTKEKS